MSDDSYNRLAAEAQHFGYMDERAEAIREAERGAYKRGLQVALDLCNNRPTAMACSVAAEIKAAIDAAPSE